MSAVHLLKNNLQSVILAKTKLLTDTCFQQTFEKIVNHIVQAYQNGGRLYIAGNGGSAADAQHLAAEFVSKLARPRAPLPAEALTVDSSVLTAIGNDYGFQEVFARQITAKATHPHDVFFAITTSGKSPNIIQAIGECQKLGIPSILLTGRNGGPWKDQATYCLIVPGEETSTIQEVHQVIYHSLCEAVEAELFPLELEGDSPS